MNRRQFLAGLSGLVTSARRGAASVYPVRFRKPAPYEAYRALIDSGRDEFDCKAEAMRVKAALSKLEPGVRHYALPGNIVRHEKKSPGEYRVGYAKSTRAAGGFESPIAFPKLLPGRANRYFVTLPRNCSGTPRHSAINCCTGSPTGAGASIRRAGIDVYGNNGIAAGDIDNDARDEIYVCQPGGFRTGCISAVPMERCRTSLIARASEFLTTLLPRCLPICANSGHQDLVVLRAAGPLLYLNRGDGTFELNARAFRFRAPARRYFEQAITRRDDAGAINNLRVLYMQTGQRNDAIAAFEYGIKAAPNEDILYLNLGRAYASIGDRDRRAR